ncbi:MAG: AarF/UbiB family protein [Planctomycetota bacterium]
MDIAARAAQALGTAQRARTVATALVRFGFGEFLTQTTLDKVIKGVTGVDIAPEAADKPMPVRVRLLLEALGPTFIKAGQILSTRPDLIPPDWAIEFKKLQSDIPPVPWEGEDGVKARLEAEYGMPVEDAFATIDTEAFAAASMAQVHRATTHTGDAVVLKVLRPGIRAVIRADLELMEWLARLTRSYFENFGFDADAVVAEFARQLERETDLELEARNVMRMAKDFEHVPGVGFPRVFHDLTRRSVLALEEVSGDVLSKLDYETLPRAERTALAKHAANAVFKQCLEIGFFHADPHPGNMFVVRGEPDVESQGEGGGPAVGIVFIDCGMTGLIDPGTMRQLAQLVHGTVDGDLNRVVRTALALGGADPTLADDRGFRTDVYHFIDNFKGGTLESLRMGTLLDEFFNVLRSHKLQCPADIVYLIKAITTIEGVAEELAPEFDLVSFVTPYVEKLIKQRYSVGAIKERFQGAAVRYADLVEELPGEVSDLLTRVKRNQVALNLEHKGLERLTNEIETASMNISWSLVLAAFIVGAALLVLADSLDRSTGILAWLAGALFIGALVLAVGRLVWSRLFNRG